jgi:hypothetical protein
MRGMFNTEQNHSVLEEGITAGRLARHEYRIGVLAYSTRLSHLFLGHP